MHAGATNKLFLSVKKSFYFTCPILNSVLIRDGSAGPALLQGCLFSQESLDGDRLIFSWLLE